MDHLDTESHEDSDADLLQRPLTVNGLLGLGSKTRKLSRRLHNREKGASETVELVRVDAACNEHALQTRQRVLAREDDEVPNDPLVESSQPPTSNDQRVSDNQMGTQCCKSPNPSQHDSS